MTPNPHQARGFWSQGCAPPEGLGRGTGSTKWLIGHLTMPLTTTGWVSGKRLDLLLTLRRTGQRRLHIWVDAQHLICTEQP